MGNDDGFQRARVSYRTKRAAVVIMVERSSYNAAAVVARPAMPAKNIYTHLDRKGPLPRFKRGRLTETNGKQLTPP